MRIGARAKLRDVRQAIGGDATIARAELLKHVEKITLERNGKIFVASGDWKLLGDESATYGWCRGLGLHRSHHEFLIVSWDVKCSLVSEGHSVPDLYRDRVAVC